ncbi:hypothetical protein ACOZ4I_03395 [Haloarcula salina]|uniref:hypothetical protein n=1 Tax=Haloarcula salina TaxID=1429914 RepID=UPI003C6EFBCD
MALQIGDALRNGLDDLLSENGVLVTGVFLLFSLANQFASASFTRALFDSFGPSGGPPGGGAGVASFVGPFSLDLALPVAAVLVVVFMLVGQLVRFWAIRLFAGPDEIRSDDARERAVMAVVLGGGVAVGLFALSMSSNVLGQAFSPVLAGIAGLAAGILSLVLNVVLVYLRQAIALNDGGYVDTVKHSLARFLDAPAQILVLLFLLFLVGLLAAIPAIASVLSVVFPQAIDLPSRSLLQVASIVLQAPVTAFNLAVITDAYVQVRADGSDETF